MSDYRDTRGGAYDHVNDFWNPQPPQVRDQETPHQKAQWARTCGPIHSRVPKRAIRCRRV